MTGTNWVRACLSSHQPRQGPPPTPASTRTATCSAAADWQRTLDTWDRVEKTHCNLMGHDCLLKAWSILSQELLPLFFVAAAMATVMSDRVEKVHTAVFARAAHSSSQAVFRVSRPESEKFHDLYRSDNGDTRHYWNRDQSLTGVASAFSSSVQHRPPRYPGAAATIRNSIQTFKAPSYS
jgi:hypothetical protein